MLQINDVSKIYGGNIPVHALSNINITIDEGEFVGVMGPSGSGKTTLLNVISTIDVPTSGQVLIDGKEIHRESTDALAKFRRDELGFIFQDFNLLHTLTVKENIVLPLTLKGEKVKVMEEKVEELGEILGIGSILNKRTYEISGGQMQRAAVARAMIHKPKVVLADEPTGNLDTQASQDVMELLTMMNQTRKTTMMLVTHDAQAAAYCDRVIFIQDGKVFSEIYKGGQRQVFFQKIIDTLSLMGGRQNDV